MSDGNLRKINEALDELTVAHSDLIDQADSMKVEVQELETKLNDLGVYVDASVRTADGTLEWREMGKTRKWRVFYSPPDDDAYQRPVLDTKLLLRLAMRAHLPALVNAITKNIIDGAPKR